MMVMVDYFYGKSLRETLEVLPMLTFYLELISGKISPYGELSCLISVLFSYGMDGFGWCCMVIERSMVRTY